MDECEPDCREQSTEHYVEKRLPHVWRGAHGDLVLRRLGAQVSTTELFVFVSPGIIMQFAAQLAVKVCSDALDLLQLIAATSF